MLMNDTASHPAFALVCTTRILCPDTDAVMGSGSFVHSRYRTKAEGEEALRRQQDDPLNEDGWKLEILPYREGEEKLRRPLYSALELHMDRWAQERDTGAPEWAL